MRRRVSAEQWAGIRALREGEAPTYMRLAAASKLHPTTIAVKAGTDNWKRLVPGKAGRLKPASPFSFPPGPPPAGMNGVALDEALGREPGTDRFAWLNDTVARALEQLVASAQAGVLDKAQVDALAALMRVLEKSEALAKERAVEKQTRSDAELAEILGRLDDRIVELAEARAEWLVGEKHSGGMGRADPGGMDRPVDAQEVPAT